MISNLYKIKWREEESKHKKRGMKCNVKVESSEVIKRQKGMGNI